MFAIIICVGIFLVFVMAFVLMYYTGDDSLERAVGIVFIMLGLLVQIVGSIVMVGVLVWKSI